MAFKHPSSFTHSFYVPGDHKLQEPTGKELSKLFLTFPLSLGHYQVHTML